MEGEDESRKMLLDDEMSRFEAEISGSPGIDGLPFKNSAAIPVGDKDRPIIGANTFQQVKQQLQQSDEPAPPGVMPPSQNFSGPPMNGNSSFGMRPPMDSPLNPPPMMNMSHESFNSNRMHMSQPPRNIPSPFGPPCNMPGPFHPPGMEPRMRPPISHTPSPNQFLERPPMFQRRDGNFSGPPMGPRPPPSFIPHQLIRSPANNNFRPGLPRANASLRTSVIIRPPPPPPNLSKSKPAKHTISKGPTLFKAQSTVISSAPKLYNEKEAEVKEEEGKPASAKLPSSTTIVVERKKKKQKVSKDVKAADNSDQSASKAITMAEKVKESIVTTKKSVQSSNQSAQPFAPQPFAPQPFAPPRPEREKKERRPKKNLRYAGGQVWEDSALNEWDKDDFRLFVGDLGNDVTDDLLTRHFNHFPSFSKAKVVREKRTNKTKGYGFISFKEPQDYIRAMKEMNGKYLGSRPIKLRKSTWKDRNLDVVQKKTKEKLLAGLK